MNWWCAFIRTKRFCSRGKSLHLSLSPRANSKRPPRLSDAASPSQSKAMDTLDTFFNNTTSHFYVVLTGTSSLLSGLMMFVEWLHYTYFGISIVDRLVALVLHVFPFLNSSKNKEEKRKTFPDGKPYRNPLPLFRGAEYKRYMLTTDKVALTEYDAVLTVLEWQSFFTYEGTSAEPADLIMRTVWMEPSRDKRMQLAHQALEFNPHFAIAMVSIAEEETDTILEVEEQLKQALRSADTAYRASSSLCHQDPIHKPLHERNATLCTYIRFRLANCARKLGKVKEAAKMYRDLIKDDRVFYVANVHENLIESLLELQNYSDVQQVLMKQDDHIKSTAMCYTLALLKAKAIGDKFCPDMVSKRGPTQPEMAAIEAIHRAVELNPHVPKYLLELKGLTFPPEHLFRRGDSEAIAYAFHHLQHWKKVDGALAVLASTWEGAFRRIPFPLERGHIFHAYPANTEELDRSVLPHHHEISVFPQKETPFFMVFSGVLCFSFMTLTVVAYHFPKAMTQYAKAVTTVFLVVLEKLIPRDIFGIFS